MARKRTVSPQFFKHEGLYDAEVAAGLPLRLGFEGLWGQADRRGIFEWRPRALKLEALPYDPVDFADVLQALEAAGFVQSYEVGGKKYGIIPSFERWQGFHKDENPSDAPNPPDTPTPADRRTPPATAPRGASNGSRPRTATPTPGEHRVNTVVTPGQPGASTVPAPGEHSATAGNPGASTLVQCPVTCIGYDNGYLGEAPAHARARNSRIEPESHDIRHATPAVLALSDLQEPAETEPPALQLVPKPGTGLARAPANRLQVGDSGQYFELTAVGEPHERQALHMLLADHPNPHILVMTLHAWATGMHPIYGTKTGRKADIEIVLGALCEMASNGEKFNARLFKGYVRSLCDRPPEPSSAEVRAETAKRAQIEQKIAERAVNARIEAATTYANDAERLAANERTKAALVEFKARYRGQITTPLERLDTSEAQPPLHQPVMRLAK